MKLALLHFYNKKIVFFAFIILLLIGVFLLVSIEKETLHLSFNKHFNDFFDVFFKYATYLGDGMVFPIIIVGLLIFKRKYATAFIIAGLITLFTSYALKHWVFSDFDRPYEVFGDTLHLVEGVKMRRHHSFPSGHTMAAFSQFMLAILFAKKFSWQMLFFSLAVIAGISRVYLSQHFVQDILLGAVIGTFIALVAYQLNNTYPLFKK